MADNPIDESQVTSTWSTRSFEDSSNYSRPLSHRASTSDASSFLSDSFPGSTYQSSPTTVLRNGAIAGRSQKLPLTSFSRRTEGNDWASISRNGNGLSSRIAQLILHAEASGEEPGPGPIFDALEDYEKRKLLGSFDAMLSDSSSTDAALWQQGWTHFFWKLSRDYPSSVSVVRDSFISIGFGPLMNTVEILSEAASRVPGGVDSKSLEDLVWAPFIAFHQRSSSVTSWDSFIRQFLKLVRRHGTTLFGKSTDGRLLKETCQWLLYVAIFDNNEITRDRAIVALLILVADSVREHGTLAPMTINLTISVFELLKYPTAPTFGKSIWIPSDSSPIAYSEAAFAPESSRNVGRTFTLKQRKVLSDIFGGGSSKRSAPSEAFMPQGIDQSVRHRRTHSTENYGISISSRSSSVTDISGLVGSKIDAVATDKWDQDLRNRLKSVLKVLYSFSLSKPKFENNELSISILEEIAGSWRWEEVKGLSGIVHHHVKTWLDHFNLKTISPFNLHAIEESYIEATKACEHVPDLRIGWLLQLSKSHSESQPPSYAEAGQSLVAAAGIIIQYLIALEDEKNLAWDEEHLEVLRGVCPDLPEVAVGLLRAADAQGLPRDSLHITKAAIHPIPLSPEDKQGKQKFTYRRRSTNETRAGRRSAQAASELGKSAVGRVAGYLELTEDSAINHLQAASQLFFSAQLYEFATKVLQLLVVVHKKRKNHKGLIRCHKDLGQLFWKMSELQESSYGYPDTANYFWVCFNGERFGPELDGKQFVYREHSETRISSFIDHLSKIYERKVGGSKNIRIISDPNFLDDTIHSGDICYLQVTPVQPVALQPEELTPVQVGVMGPYKQFYFKLPDVQMESFNNEPTPKLPVQWKHRAILTIKGSFPSFLTRWQVETSQTRVVSPLELAIDEIGHFTSILNREMESLPEKGDVSQLTNALVRPLTISLQSLTQDNVLSIIPVLIHHVPEQNSDDVKLPGSTSFRMNPSQAKINDGIGLDALGRQNSGLSDSGSPKVENEVAVWLQNSNQQNNLDAPGITKLRKLLTAPSLKLNLKNRIPVDGKKLSELLQEYMDVCLNALRKIQTRNMTRDSSDKHAELARKFRYLSQELSNHIPTMIAEV